MCGVAQRRRCLARASGRENPAAGVSGGMGGSGVAGGAFAVPASRAFCPGLRCALAGSNRRTCRSGRPGAPSDESKKPFLDGKWPDPPAPDGHEVLSNQDFPAIAHRPFSMGGLQRPYPVQDWRPQTRAGSGNISPMWTALSIRVRLVGWLALVCLLAAGSLRRNRSARPSPHRHATGST